MISGEFWHWTLRSCPGSVAAPRATHQQQASTSGMLKKMSGLSMMGTNNVNFQWEVMLKYEKPIGFGGFPKQPEQRC